MKSALFAVLVSLVLVMSWSQPAYAANVVVHNNVDVTIYVDVYYGNGFCSADRSIQLPPRGMFLVSAGECKPTRVDAQTWIQGRTGVVCKAYERVPGPFTERTFRVERTHSGCSVKGGA